MATNVPTTEEDREKKKEQKAKSSDNDHPASTSPSFSCEAPYPYDDKMKTKVYESTLVKLQIELNKVQRWVEDKGKKIVIVFEGRDAAGKGGTIKRFREHLNPRTARLVALPKPNDAERGQWYFQRYVAHLPTRGEIVFFDRSWYNRAGVEPVMGFCTPQDYQRFIHQVPSLEEALIESGIRMFKLWFDVSRDEQRRRINARKKDPLKHWKLGGLHESTRRDVSVHRYQPCTMDRHPVRRQETCKDRRHIICLAIAAICWQG